MAMAMAMAMASYYKSQHRHRIHMNIRQHHFVFDSVTVSSGKDARRLLGSSVIPFHLLASLI
jgi:hypothetical protein